MNTTGEKVVIDTNVFITIFKTDSKNRWMLEKIISGDWILCISNEIFLEYWEILEQKTNAAIAGSIVDFILIHPYVEFCESFFNWNLIKKDPDDNKFCDCCFAASASFLISNDSDFRVLKTIEFPSLPLYTSDEIFQVYKEK
jgi:uncharacterized protein